MERSGDRTVRPHRRRTRRRDAGAGRSWPGPGRCWTATPGCSAWRRWTSASKTPWPLASTSDNSASWSASSTARRRSDRWPCARCVPGRPTRQIDSINGFPTIALSITRSIISLRFIERWMLSWCAVKIKEISKRMATFTNLWWTFHDDWSDVMKIPKNRWRRQHRRPSVKNACGRRWPRNRRWRGGGGGRRFSSEIPRKEKEKKPLRTLIFTIRKRTVVTTLFCRDCRSFGVLLRTDSERTGRPRFYIKPRSVALEFAESRATIYSTLLVADLMDSMISTVAPI